MLIEEKKWNQVKCPLKGREDRRKVEDKRETKNKGNK